MEKQKAFKTPIKTLVGMQVVHFGKILFNLQFIALAVMAASVLSFLIPVIYYLLLLCIALLTLFTVFINPTFLSLWSGGEALTKIADTLAQSWKYTIPIVAALAVASLICLCFDKNKKHPARIAVCAVICILALAVLILKLANAEASK